MIVSQASNASARATKEINQAVGSLDQTTQRNAAMVEESTAASQKLAAEAEALRTLLGQFQFADSAPTRQHRSRKAA
jgi:methyl-accepting chemotaxis protein